MTMWNRRWWGVGIASLGALLLGGGLIVAFKQGRFSEDEICAAFDAGRMAQREAGDNDPDDSD